MRLRAPQRGDRRSESRKPERARARGNSEDVLITRSGLRALSQTCPCLSGTGDGGWRRTSPVPCSSSAQIHSFERFNIFIFMNVFFTDADRLAILLIGFARAARSVILILFGSK